MATNKSSKSSSLSKQLSWKKLLIAASVTANIGFVVIFITMINTTALDGMFIKEGLQRYCLPQNDNKFTDAGAYTNALREYTCARGEAKSYYEAGLNSYLDYKGIPEITE